MRTATMRDGEYGPEQARAWTVMGRLRQHGERLIDKTLSARRRIGRSPCAGRYITANDDPALYQDALAARWKGGPHVLALLFAHPDSDAMRTLAGRIDYFDHRTGDNWDLFFPGYYEQERDKPTFDDRVAALAGGRRWLFNALGFSMIRSHVEGASEGRWHYSGDTDLVLINVWLPGSRYVEPEIDWASTLSGRLTDRDAQVKTLSLGGVVERISRDLETAMEDPAYGVGDVTTTSTEVAGRHGFSRDVVVGALGGIVAELAKQAAGM